MDNRIAFGKSVSYGISDRLLKKKPKISISSTVLLLVALTLIVTAIRISCDNSHKEKELDALNAQLEQSENEIALLEEKTEDRVDDELIIRTAEDKYGMVKRDQLEVKQVYVAGEDERELLKTDDSDKGNYSIFSAIGKTLKELLEYIGK